MAVESHLAKFGIFHVDPLGNIYQRGNDARTIKEVLVFETQHRIVEDTVLVNTLGNPTLETYLGLEAGDDFQLKEVNQSFVVTEKIT